MMAGLVLKVSTTKIPSDDEDSCTNNAMLTPNQNSFIPPSGSIPNIPSISANGFPSQQFSPRRRILFTVKVVRADIDSQTGKPVNALKYNRVVTVPI